MLGLLTSVLRTKESETAREMAVVEVYGVTEGSITGADKVVVAPTGCCRSNVQATCLDIAGEVYGDVDVEELIIRRMGHLYGQARYKKLILAEGAVYCPKDSGDETDTSPRPVDKAVGPCLVARQEQARTVSLQQDTGAGQLRAASEQNKKEHQSETLEGEQQEPCFITSF